MVRQCHSVACFDHGIRAECQYVEPEHRVWRWRQLGCIFAEEREGVEWYSGRWVKGQFDADEGLEGLKGIELFPEQETKVKSTPTVLMGISGFDVRRTWRRYHKNVDNSWNI